ncbi:MAG: hypothetical protein U1F43_20250 [Myxococcota bacterium]
MRRVPGSSNLSALVLALGLTLVGVAACDEAPRGRVVPSIPIGALGPDVARDGLRVPNGLTDELVGHALGGEALQSSAVGEAVRGDPAFATFMRYVVECALPPDAEADFGGGIVYAGMAGLAPEWLDAPCDEACQEWTTACLAARTNVFGLTVDVVLEADHENVGWGSLEPNEEGVFYGNLFQPTSRVYACRGSGYDPLMMAVRVCSQPGSRCGMQWVGACGEVDGDTGVGADRHACAPEVDGMVRTCWNRATARGHDAPPEPFRAYTRLVRVKLKRTGFAPACGGIPWDPFAEPRPDPLADNICQPKNGTDVRCLGQSCVNDDGCGGESFVCDTSGPLHPVCSATCLSSADQADEEAQCGGPDTTCVGLLGDGEVGYCARRCAPVGTEGYRCPAGAFCSGGWVSQPGSVDDVPGCQRGCASDADCLTGVCNARFLGCGDPPDLTKLRDGEACSLGTLVSECRGFCAPLADGPPGRGLCASFIDYADGRECPDDPATMRPNAADVPDDVRLCFLRECRAQADCQAPLVCRAAGTRSLCLYPLYGTWTALDGGRGASGRRRDRVRAELLRAQRRAVERGALVAAAAALAAELAARGQRVDDAVQLGVVVAAAGDGLEAGAAALAGRGLAVERHALAARRGVLGDLGRGVGDAVVARSVRAAARAARARGQQRGPQRGEAGSHPHAAMVEARRRHVKGARRPPRLRRGACVADDGRGAARYPPAPCHACRDRRPRSWVAMKTSPPSWRASIAARAS